MRTAIKKLSAVVLTVSVLLSLAAVPEAQAAAPKLNKTSITLAKGSSCTLKVKNTKKKVKWKSMNKKVATVTSKGRVTGKKKGTTYITASVSGKKLSCKVTVNDGPYTNLSKNNNKSRAGSEKLYVSKGRSFTVKIYKVSGKAYKGTSVKWKSMDKTIASVSKRGRVTGKKKGTTYITAAVAGKTFSIETTVEEPYQTNDPEAFDNGKQSNGGYFKALQGVTWEQKESDLLYYEDGKWMLYDDDTEEWRDSTQTFKMYGTSQKITWRAQFIKSDGTKNLSDANCPADKYIRGCKKGVLSSDSASCDVTLAMEVPHEATYRITATLADGAKYNFYVFFNNPNTGFWNVYRSARELQDISYSYYAKKKYPDAVYGYEENLVYLRKSDTCSEDKLQWVVCSKEEAFKDTILNTTALGLDERKFCICIKDDKYGKMLDNVYYKDGTKCTDKMFSINQLGSDFTGLCPMGKDGSAFWGNEVNTFRGMPDISEMDPAYEYFPVFYILYVNRVTVGEFKKNKVLFYDECFDYGTGGARGCLYIYSCYWQRIE